MESLKGCFLIASRHLADPNFARTVVLLLDHSPSGAIGLVLNRPTSKHVHDISQMIELEFCENDCAISMGGPVQGPLMCLHAHPAHSDAEIVEGVHLATQRDTIHAILRDHVSPLKVFAGYSGWGAGQLEREIEAGGWFVLAASSELVFTDGVDEMWALALHQSGREFYRETLGLTDFPDDASLN
ncbi:MAG TPA: YqgE/AlgH family protein [Pirellulaceae bacterium]